MIQTLIPALASVIAAAIGAGVSASEGEKSRDASMEASKRARMAQTGLGKQAAASSQMQAPQPAAVTAPRGGGQQMVMRPQQSQLQGAFQTAAQRYLNRPR